MHMADALLSPAVGMAMNVVSGGALAYSIAQTNRDELAEKKLPIMAVSGAFVFAAQMINFTIPLTGSSGHIGGGILLAALLGSFPAALTLSVVLFIQCLFFADGGVLALGCNIWNIAIVPCLIAYPLLFRPLTKKGLTPKTITTASILSAVIGMQLGAFGVVVQTAVSGVSGLPFSTFAMLMQPIHLAIGLVEGIVTGAILCYVYKARPEILESASRRVAIDGSIRRTLAVAAIATVLVGGVLSLLASSHPDGLEWSIERIIGVAEAEGVDGYGFAMAGIVGSGLTFALAGGIGLLIFRVKQCRK